MILSCLARDCFFCLYVSAAIIEVNSCFKVAVKRIEIKITYKFITLHNTKWCFVKKLKIQLVTIV